MKIEMKIEHILIKIILFSGILLVLIQFFSGRSIWRDEAVLALNIINRSSSELLKPLDFLQVAPILFLQIEKYFSILLPDIDLGLRVFPLLCFFLAFYFFYRLLFLLFNDPRTIIFALSLFVFNATILRYASEVKQYMCDVLAISAISYFVVKSSRIGKKDFIVLGIAGALSIFISNVAPIILFTAGLYFLHSYLFVGRSSIKSFILPMMLWGIAFVVYYSLFIHNHPNMVNQVNAFSKVDGFLPSNPFSIEFYNYLGKVFMYFFETLLPFVKMGLVCFGVFFAIGVIALIRQKKVDFLILTLSPIIIHLFLSALKMYPFMPRLILYQTPLLIIIISFGYEQLINLTLKNLKSAVCKGITGLLPILLIFSMFTFNEFPWKGPEIKRSIVFIQERIKPNEKLFIHAAAQKSFQYYKKINFVKFSNTIFYGKTWNYRDKEGFSEFQPLRGRTWLLFVDRNNNEYKRMAKRLEKEGYQMIETFVANKTSAYLFDFGND